MTTMASVLMSNPNKTVTNLRRHSSTSSTTKNAKDKKLQQPGKLFVGGLAFTTTDDALYAYFSKFGRIKTAIVMRNPSSKRSRGFGFVVYDSATSAAACVKFTGTHVVDDQEVDVKHATPRVDAAPSDKPKGGVRGVTRGGKIIIGGRGGGVSKGQRGRPYGGSSGGSSGNSGGGGGPRGGAYGASQLSRSNQSSRSAPVAFSSSSTIAAPPVSGSSEILDGEYGEDEDDYDDGLAGTNKIFVGGLHYHTRKPGLMRYFEQFGSIRTAQVLYAKDTGKSRGFGFITFDDPMSVVRVMHQRMHTVDGKQAEVKRATPKTDTSPILTGKKMIGTGAGSGMPGMLSRSSMGGSNHGNSSKGGRRGGKVGAATRSGGGGRASQRGGSTRGGGPPGGRSYRIQEGGASMSGMSLDQNNHNPMVSSMEPQGGYFPPQLGQMPPGVVVPGSAQQTMYMDEKTQENRATSSASEAPTSSTNSIVESSSSGSFVSPPAPVPIVAGPPFNAVMIDPVAGPIVVPVVPTIVPTPMGPTMMTMPMGLPLQASAETFGAWGTVPVQPGISPGILPSIPPGVVPTSTWGNNNPSNVNPFNNSFGQQQSLYNNSGHGQLLNNNKGGSFQNFATGTDTASNDLQSGENSNKSKEKGGK